MSLAAAARAAAVAVFAATAGCAAGQGAATAHVKASVQGSSADLGTLALRDFYLAPEGSVGYIVGTIVNTGSSADSLLGVDTTAGTVTVGSIASVSSPPSPSPSPTPSSRLARRHRRAVPPSPSPSPRPSPIAADLAPGVPMLFGAPELGPGPDLLVQGLPPGVSAGTYVTVTFRFAAAGTVTVSLPVHPVSGTTATATPIPTDTTPTGVPVSPQVPVSASPNSSTGAAP